MEEAIELHLYVMRQDNEPLPTPQPLEVHQHHTNYASGVWALVTVDLSKISGKAKRVNITLLERILTIVHQYAMQHSETRSGLIAQATMVDIASQYTALN